MELEPSFWNTLHLSPPEILPCKITGNKPNIIGSSMLLSVEKIISDLSCLNQLNAEGAVISRLVYRYKRKLRSDKGFKSLQKINHLLHNYLKLKFNSMIEEVRNCIFDKKGPSKQVLEWCLVNILRFASLFHKIYIICLDGARYLKERFTSGDFWTAASLCYAAVSRVWTFSLYIVKCSSMWFKELTLFLPHMAPSDETWLPDSFKFPKSVREWLNNPEYLEKVSQSNKSPPELENELSSENNILNSCKSFMVTEDLGESVSRETGELVNKENPTKTKLTDVKKPNLPTKSKTAEFFKKLNSKDALIDFMCKEGVLRQSKSDCITSYLSDKRWAELRTALSKHIGRMVKFKGKRDENNKISRAVKCIQFFMFHTESDLKKNTIAVNCLHLMTQMKWSSQNQPD